MDINYVAWFHTSRQAPVERANAMLKQFKALQHVTLSAPTSYRHRHNSPSHSIPQPQQIPVRKAQS